MATDVLVPPLGQTVDTVTLVAWYKEEGESVSQGEMLFAIETDKATLDVEAPASGVLRQVSARPGDQVQVLTAIALIVASGEQAGEKGREAASLPPESPDPAPLARKTGLGRDAERAGKGQADSGRRIFVSPRARRLAEAHAVPLAALAPTGPEGAIVERDVQAYLDAHTAAPAITPVARRMAQAAALTITPVARRVAEAAGLQWRELAGSGPSGRIMRSDVDQALAEGDVVEPEVRETIPVRGVRAVVAERMIESATSTARVTLNAEADATALVDLRRRLVEDGVDVAYNDLLLYILGRALREHPAVNASWAAGTIKRWRPIHVGLAVDTDRGLLVPVVQDVDRKGLQQLAAESRDLVERARAGACTPEELGGGTFTLTNLGMFGIDSFTPIINLPEAAILGVGRIQKRPAVVGDAIVARHLVWLSLTFDHRLLDGAPAARFLQRVVQLVERPHLLVA